MSPLRLANLSLLIAFPIGWGAPLLRAGFLPLFGLSEISVLSGVASLWQTDILLALLVIVLAMVAPIAKVLTLEGVLSNRLPVRIKPWLFHLGRLAMADVFLIAIYITVAKGIGIGRLEVAWGMYLFTACVVTSLALSLISARKQT
ncbi:paraquat-inducible protein A [Celeribacter marinus]|uniref:Paraquat-inducible protein A n=1 Tax=Celeribacter marinus TaxID=1397108 RepID=A0A0N9ZI60_9RHOB|nr:paraquat-inducible protein A [Celeribacter marinus]ALI56337.1 paraquat-inducible protein A [Celeribacter marinus]SFK45697.1 Paraquat-inducible protein A [Celeribacter marinus]